MPEAVSTAPPMTPTVPFVAPTTFEPSITISALEFPCSYLANIHLGLRPPPQPNLPASSEPLAPIEDTIPTEDTTTVEVQILPPQEATMIRAQLEENIPWRVRFTGEVPHAKDIAQSKSLPSVGNSRKSYLKVTSQRLARGKLVHLLGWRSLALPSVGLGENDVCEISQTHKKAAKSLRSKRLFSQAYEVGFHLEVLSFQLAAYIGQLQEEIHHTVQKGCEITSQQKGDFATLCKMLPSE
ncbi:hypothetical protein CK203_041558 [Vitis vinifera]|uniref:Uncharacterized protein n=1 Tax=Vitis vinifera TaxID=29760 RepID=A0A438I7I7_VITVI|nr:hypothetical protein CK203_041558 [Vitis vinifera]